MVKARSRRRGGVREGVHREESRPASARGAAAGETNRAAGAVNVLAGDPHAGGSL
jgi:hypothetical protein